MLEHYNISHLSGYKTPAKARYFIEYNGHNFDALREATQFAYSNNLPILTIAGGRNSLLAFDEYQGLVVYNNSIGYELINNKKSSEKAPFLKGRSDKFTPSNEGGKISGGEGNIEENKGDLLGINPPSSQSSDTSFKKEVLLQIQSGQMIWELAEELETKHGITFWHRFLGLPGSIGGAVYGNAGCFGLEIGPYVTNVSIFDMRSGERFSRTGEELHFSYRWSECKNHPEWFIISVECDLSKAIEKYPAPPEDPLAWRSRVQPEGLSCGSFFKNPSRENSAGSLLEKVGLRGYHHGGAYFSDKHANFLMSDGTAKWSELIELIQLAQKKILEETGIQLEPEVRIVR